MKKTVSIILAVIFILALSASVFADYPKSDSYFYDGADIITPEAEAEIKTVNDTLFVSKGYRIAVCTVDNTGDVPSETYARGVFGEWEVKGVLILIVKSTEYYYAVQSSSLSEVLTDEKLSGILNTSLEGEFAAKNYSAGLSATVKALSSFINENVTSPSSTDKKADNSKSGGSKVGKFFKGLGIFALIVVILLAAGYGLLVYLEKKKENERRLLLEEKRRRLAQSGRGSYYGNPSDPRRINSAPAQRGTGDPRYGVPTAQGGTYQPHGTGARDRFVYPDQTQVRRQAPRQYAAPTRNNAGGTVRNTPPRGQRVDFDKEYYTGSADVTDSSATREFTRH